MVPTTHTHNADQWRRSTGVKEPEDVDGSRATLLVVVLLTLPWHWLAPVLCWWWTLPKVIRGSIDSWYLTAGSSDNWHQRADLLYREGRSWWKGRSTLERCLTKTLIHKPNVGYHCGCENQPFAWHHCHHAIVPTFRWLSTCMQRFLIYLHVKMEV